MKKVTMQEFADMFEVYVAKDGDGTIYAYSVKPTIDINEAFWNNNLATQPIGMFIKDASGIDWKDSFCTPQKSECLTAKVYHTPCGDFEEGEEVMTVNGVRIFYTYDERLIDPYICVDSGYTAEYRNNENFDLIFWNKVKKIPEKKYKAYDKPSLE